MPLVRAEIPAGQSDQYRAAVGEAVQVALHVALGVPMQERFQIITEHRADALVIDPAYLGIDRSSQAIIIQVMLNEGRDTALKKSFFKALADNLHVRIGVRREDVIINLVEVKRENWSFGNGEAQLA